jgi:hypothetical protein
LFEGRSDAYTDWGEIQNRLSAEAKKEAEKGNPRPSFVFMIGAIGKSCRFSRYQRSGETVTYLRFANGGVVYDSDESTYDVTTRNHHNAIKAFLRTIIGVTNP